MGHTAVPSPEQIVTEAPLPEKPATETTAGAAASGKEASIDFSTQVAEASGTVSGSLGDILFLRSSIKKGESAVAGNDMFHRTPALSMLRGRISDIDGDGKDNDENIDGGFTKSELSDLQNPTKKGPKKNLRGIGRHARLDEFFKISTSTSDPNDFKGKDVDGASMGRLEGDTDAHWYYDNSKSGPIDYNPTAKAREGVDPYVGEMIWDKKRKKWRPMVRLPDPLVAIPQEKIKSYFSQSDTTIKKKKKPKGAVTGGNGNAVVTGDNLGRQVVGGAPKHGDAGAGACGVSSTAMLTGDLKTISGRLLSIEEMFFKLILCKNDMVYDVQRLAATIVILDDKLCQGKARLKAEEDLTEQDIKIDIAKGDVVGEMADGGLSGPVEHDKTMRSMIDRIADKNEFEAARAVYGLSGQSEATDFYSGGLAPGQPVSGSFEVHLLNETSSTQVEEAPFELPPFAQPAFLINNFDLADGSFYTDAGGTPGVPVFP